MNPNPPPDDDKRYYEMQLAMFESEGWKYFTAQVEEMRAATNQIAGVALEDLRHKQGELSVMDWVLGWPRQVRWAYETSDAVMEPDASDEKEKAGA